MKTEDSKETNRNLLTKENKYFRHVLTFRKWYLLLLMVVVIALPLLNNFMADKPLLMGGESYEHLAAARQMEWQDPLAAVLLLFPLSIYFLVPLFIAIGTLLLFFILGKRLKLSPKFMLFFCTFVILSPAFIFTFSTLSSYSLFTLLVILGFLFITQKNKWTQYLAAVPFVIATLFDIFSAFLLLLVQFWYLLQQRRIEKEIMLPKTLAGITLLLLIFNLFVLKLPLFSGPFHVQQAIPDLVSDLGGLSGISLFSLLLAFIGFTIAWKKKKFSFAYFLLIPVILAYIYSTQVIFLVSLVVALFTTTGFIRMFEWKWQLDMLKKFTFLLLLLGIVFSALTYLDRITLNVPTANDEEALTWIKENTPTEAIVFSVPENSYYVRYFAQRQPLYFPHQRDVPAKNSTAAIMKSIYIDELFPLLEENNISILYITPQMKAQLPADRGLIMLLKNERFKLVHSSGEVEVWEFGGETS